MENNILKTRNIIGKICIILGWQLLIVAAMVVGYEYYEVNNAYIFSETTVAEIQDTIDNEISDLEEIEYNGKVYIGLLEIPTLNLKLPILRNCTDENLRLAPCRFFGDIYLDEPVVFAAHNYPKFFGNLKYLKKDDDIYFRMLDGKRIQYKVKETESIDGTDVEGMTNTEYDLTLFTCNYAKDKRITVRCNKY